MKIRPSNHENLTHSYNLYICGHLIKIDGLNCKLGLFLFKIKIYIEILIVQPRSNRHKCADRMNASDLLH